MPTNFEQLRAILAHPEFRAGNARTTLLSEAMATPKAKSGALQFLDQQAAALGRGRGAASAPPARPLPVPTGHEAIESPHAGSVVEVKAREGAAVKAGDLLFVVSAMKMETSVAAPCAGTVTTLAALSVGDPVEGGQILAVIRPAAGAARAAAPLTADESWTPMLDKVAALQAIAHKRLAPGSNDPGVVRQRNRRKLTCRERIDGLLDPGSFREIGSLAGFATFDEAGDVAEFTPASHVGGQGRIEGRACIVCADDFTSRGGHADGAIGQKSRYLDRLSIELRAPSIRLLDGSSGGGSVATMVPKQDGAADESTAQESTGAIKAGRPRVVGGGGSFLPGHLGSTYYTEQLATVPVVNLLLGSVVGIGAAKAVLGHFSVMVRDISQLFVAGPPVVSHAMGYEVTKEDLGGWHIHCRNGSVDNLAEIRGGGHGDDAALPVVPAVQRLRGAAGRADDGSRRPPRGGAADAWCRASARRPSTCGAPSG